MGRKEVRPNWCVLVLSCLLRFGTDQIGKNRIFVEKGPKWVILGVPLLEDPFSDMDLDQIWDPSGPGTSPSPYPLDGHTCGIRDGTYSEGIRRWTKMGPKWGPEGGALPVFPYHAHARKYILEHLSSPGDPDLRPPVLTPSGSPQDLNPWSRP